MNSDKEREIFSMIIKENKRLNKDNKNADEHKGTIYFTCEFEFLYCH